MILSMFDTIRNPSKEAPALCPRCGGLIPPGDVHSVASCLTITAARVAALELVVVSLVSDAHRGRALNLASALATALSVPGCPWPRPSVPVAEPEPT